MSATRTGNTLLIQGKEAGLGDEEEVNIVVSATVTSLLLAIAIQVHKRNKTVDPDELNALRG